MTRCRHRSQQVEGHDRRHGLPAAPSAAARRRGGPALERGRTTAGSEWTFAEYADHVARAAAGLRALGVEPGDRVVLMMRNIPEFHVLDLAAAFCGATPVSIYNSSSPEQVAYLVSHCEAKVGIVEDAGFLDASSRCATSCRRSNDWRSLDDPDGVAGPDVGPSPDSCTSTAPSTSTRPRRWSAPTISPR